MAHFDLPLDELRTYEPALHEPADFDAFWSETLAGARAEGFAPRFEPFDAGLTTVEVSDVTFAGFGGDGGPKRISVWPYNGHEGGGVQHTIERADMLRSTWPGL